MSEAQRRLGCGSPPALTGPGREAEEAAGGLVSVPPRCLLLPTRSAPNAECVPVVRCHLGPPAAAPPPPLASPQAGGRRERVAVAERALPLPLLEGAASAIRGVAIARGKGWGPGRGLLGVVQTAVGEAPFCMEGEGKRANNPEVLLKSFSNPPCLCVSSSCALSMQDVAFSFFVADYWCALEPSFPPL